METLDLLNILDLIKNESTYTKRLQNIKDAEAEYAESRSIAATVELANRYLLNAKEAEASRAVLMEEAKKDIERLRIEKLADLEAREAKVSAKLEQTEQARDNARIALAACQVQREANEQRTKELKDWETIITNLEKSAREVEAVCTSKFKRIQEIIEE